MENQEVPTSNEPRVTEQDLFQMLSSFATAYQFDKQHQEAADQRGHQLRVMTEQNRHDEAVQWLSSLEGERKERYELMRHQFDRQFWFVVALVLIAIAVMCGLIFVKDDLKTAVSIFIAILSYLAGRKGQGLLIPPALRPVDPPTPVQKP